MDYDSDGRSLSSGFDTEIENPVATTRPKRFLKPPKFDGVRSFEAFWPSSVIVPSTVAETNRRNWTISVTHWKDKLQMCSATMEKK